MEEDERTSLYQLRAAGSAPVALLRATLSRGGLTTLPLGPRPAMLTVGRHPSCDWLLADATVSRRHALLRWSGRELTLEDLGSTGGTTIDARRVGEGEQWLAPGQRVCMGDTTFHLELLETRPAGAQADSLASEKTLLVKNPLDEETLIVKLPAATAAPAPVSAGEERDSDDADVDRPVYIPERDALGPQEETRSWPIEAALARSREPLFSLPRLSSLLQRRPKPADDDKQESTEPVAKPGKRVRPILVAGPLLLAVVSCASAFLQKPTASAAAGPGSEPAATATAVLRRPRAAPPPSRAPAPPLPTSAATATAVATPPDPPASPDEHDAALAGAIHAYKNGDRTQALLRFRQLARDPSDATARFMARLVEMQQTHEGQ